MRSPKKVIRGANREEALAIGYPAQRFKFGINSQPLEHSEIGAPAGVEDAIVRVVSRTHAHSEKQVSLRPVLHSGILS